MNYKYSLSKGGHDIFVVGQQIANPQILELIISQSQIRKFLRCASPEIANPLIPCNSVPKLAQKSYLNLNIFADLRKF